MEGDRALGESFEGALNTACALAVLGNDLHDSVCRPAVPEGRRPGQGRRMVQGPEGFLQDHLRVGPDDLVRPMGDGDGTLRAVAQGEARNAQDGRLFLNSPRVGQDETRSTHQRDEVEIAKRVETRDSRAGKGLARN